ncbi:MAG: hypothetical protein KAG86_01980, partial [Gammaproteobacteria bacterium]|nr:hypothetical protein [Gammaproteobacteria bacterium]
PNNSSIQESLSVGTYYLKITDYYRNSEAQYYLKISDGRQPQNYTISSSAGTGGHISPSTMTVNDGNTGSFTLTTNTGYGIGSVNGTCGGTLNGNIYTTNAITSNCTIFASFILNGQATLTSPSGEIITNTPTYTWEAVSNATWYYLWVNDTTGTLIKKWYTAEAAGCATGSTCSVSPSSSVTGSGKWWIKGWNAQGDYPWSDAMSFIVPNGGVPSIASLVSPSGEMTTDKPSYTWNAVANATWYYLWVNDSVGTRIKIWRTASESGCANGIGLCTYSTPTVLAKGSGGWWVQTWNSSGYGPWSNKASFNITNNKVPAAATLVAPIGSISRNTLPHLKWNAVQGSTWYYLWLNDGSETLVKEWWSASEAGCASGTGICVAGPLNPVNQLTKDNGAWWVRTWNKAGYGPWSQKASFSRD